MEKIITVLESSAYSSPDHEVIIATPIEKAGSLHLGTKKVKQYEKPEENRIWYIEGEDGYFKFWKDNYSISCMTINLPISGSINVKGSLNLGYEEKMIVEAIWRNNDDLLSTVNNLSEKYIDYDPNVLLSLIPKLRNYIEEMNAPHIDLESLTVRSQKKYNLYIFEQNIDFILQILIDKYVDNKYTYKTFYVDTDCDDEDCYYCGRGQGFYFPDEITTINSKDKKLAIKDFKKHNDIKTLYKELDVASEKNKIAYTEIIDKVNMLNEFYLKMICNGCVDKIRDAILNNVYLFRCCDNCKCFCEHFAMKNSESDIVEYKSSCSNCFHQDIIKEPEMKMAFEKFNIEILKYGIDMRLV